MEIYIYRNREREGELASTVVCPLCHFYLLRAKSLAVLKNSIGIDESIMASRFQLPRFPWLPLNFGAINVGNKLQLCLCLPNV